MGLFFGGQVFWNMEHREKGSERSGKEEERQRKGRLKIENSRGENVFIKCR